MIRIEVEFDMDRFEDRAADFLHNLANLLASYKHYYKEIKVTRQEEKK